MKYISLVSRAGRHIAYMLVMLSVLVAPAAVYADTFAIVIDGAEDYSAHADHQETLRKGAVFSNKTFSAADALDLMFDSNGSSKPNRVYDENGMIYGTLFQRNTLKITPKNGATITKVIIATAMDKTTGFVDNATGTALKHSGNTYQWTGSATGVLKLRLTSTDANNNLGFTYIEVTYNSSEPSTDPVDPNPDKPTPDNPDPDNPDPDQPGPDNPDPDVPDPDEPDPIIPEPEDPEPIADVIISPDGGMILPSQKISISCATEGAKIYYTVNGTTPSAKSKPYSRPFSLSLADGMTVTALAISPDGQTSRSTQSYFFGEVTTIEDFFLNPSNDEPVELNVPLQIVYKHDQTAYLRILLGDGSDYLCVNDAGSYLRNIAAGRVLDGIYATAGYEGDIPVATLASRPSTDAIRSLPDPEVIRLSDLSVGHVNKYVSVENCRITREGKISQGSNSAGLDDCFETVTPSLREIDVDITGFVSLDRRGLPAIRPIYIAETENGENPPEPDKPSDGDSYKINSVSIGNGKVEIFAAYNSYTLTPEGMPLTLPAEVKSGDNIFIYFRPDGGHGIASVVAGSNVVTGDSDRLIDTPYGKMLTISVDSDMTIVTTFTPSSSATRPDADTESTPVWYDLSGRRIDKTPSTPGVYIRRVAAASAVVIVRK